MFISQIIYCCFSQIRHCCLSVKPDIVVYQSNQTLLFMSQRRHCCLLVIEDFVVHQSNQTLLFISQISHCCLSVKSDIVVYHSNQKLLFISRWNYFSSNSCSGYQFYSQGLKTSNKHVQVLAKKLNLIIKLLLQQFSDCIVGV